MIEATAEQIRALLSLVERDEAAPHLLGKRAQGADEADHHGLPPRVLARYDALVAAGRWPPVATIDRGTCSGCHLRLPTMVESKAAHSLGLYACPHCRRMLYSRELLQPAGAGHSPPSRRKGRAPAKSGETSGAARPGPRT